MCALNWRWLLRLRCFIVTPAMHKVHHSRLQPETYSNYSSMLSVWDRVFRSFRLRDDPHTIQFGLDGWDAAERQTVEGLVKTPVVAGLAKGTGCLPLRPLWGR